MGFHVCYYYCGGGFIINEFKKLKEEELKKIKETKSVEECNFILNNIIRVLTTFHNGKNTEKDYNLLSWKLQNPAENFKLNLALLHNKFHFDMTHGIKSNFDSELIILFASTGCRDCSMLLRNSMPCVCGHTNGEHNQPYHGCGTFTECYHKDKGLFGKRCSCAKFTLSKLIDEVK